MDSGRSSRSGSTSASRHTSSPGGYAVVEIALTAGFLFAVGAALAALSMFITRAEARDRREHDTDHDL